MVKKDIIKNVSKNLGIDEHDIRAVIDSTLKEMHKGLSEGENIYLRGFGTFAFKTSKERLARDIYRGVDILIPERKKIYFKAGKKLEENISKLNKQDEKE